MFLDLATLQSFFLDGRVCGNTLHHHHHSSSSESDELADYEDGTRNGFLLYHFKLHYSESCLM